MAAPSEQEPICARLERFWSTHNIAQLLSTQFSPVVIASNLPVAEACQVLANHGISSAPVLDSTKGVFIGQIEYADLVAYVLAASGKAQIPDGHGDLAAALRGSGAGGGLPATAGNVAGAWARRRGHRAAGAVAC